MIRHVMWLMLLLIPFFFKFCVQVSHVPQQRFAEFLSTKQKSAGVFSHPSAPQSLSAEDRKIRFDVFDTSFQSQAPQSSEAGADASLAAGPAESEAFTKFLQSDSQVGEIPTMKADWFRRMRLDIVAAEEKYQKAAASVQAHKDSGGKSDDPTFAKQNFILSEMKGQRETMSIDSEEGNVSSREAPPNQFLTHVQVPTKLSQYYMKAVEKFLIQQSKDSTKSIVAELAE